MGSRLPTVFTEDDLIDTRIAEMDEEGIDIELMVPSPFTGHQDPAVDLEFMKALHRYLDDVCSRHPGRLKSILQVSGRDVEGSVQEMRHWAESDWAVALQVDLPLGYPLDHPDLEPIWAEASAQGLCLVPHSSSSGYPGERDLWDNPFLGRSASHPWGAMRAMAAFFGAGIMDRHPNLRFAILESGFGWLPFWGKRLDDQVHYMGYVAEDLQHSIWEYLTGGRFFAGIVLHEGEVASDLCELPG
jgi:predicted TIM-barrel fold metal-dependent hydrolase